MGGRGTILAVATSARPHQGEAAERTSIERRQGVTIAYPSTPPVVAPPSGSARPRLTFLGTGYLGATYAICFAELGYEVIGFDIDEAKIAKLAGGDVPFHEPGLDELLRKNLSAGRL